MPQMNIQDAHDLSDGITFNDKLGLFYGNQSPNLVDALNVPDGSVYLQIGGGLWHKRNRVWLDITLQVGAGISSHVHSNMAILDSTTATFTSTLKSAYDSMVHHNHDALYAYKTHTHDIADITNMPTCNVEVSYLYDRRNRGDDGTSLDKDTWNPRALLQVESSTGIVTLQGDDFAVGKTGTYSISCQSIGGGKLRVVDEGTGLGILEGLCVDDSKGMTSVSGIVHLKIGTLIEIQHWVTHDIEMESQELGDWEQYLQVEVIYYGS